MLGQRAVQISGQNRIGLHVPNIQVGGSVAGAFGGRQHMPAPPRELSQDLPAHFVQVAVRRKQVYFHQNRGRTKKLGIF